MGPGLACIQATHCWTGDDARHRNGGTGSFAAANDSGRAPLVAIMQAADLWEGDNVAGRGWLRGRGSDNPCRARDVAALVMVLKVCRQLQVQVTLIEDVDVMETFAPDRADAAVDIGIPPWRSRRGYDVLDGHRVEHGRWKAAPYEASPSRNGKRGAVSQERPR